MDILDSITKRMSVRAFKPDPVSREVLQEIMDRALWAPSWGNTQPWDFFIAAGDKLADIQKGFVEKEEAIPAMEIPRPQQFPEHYVKRRQIMPVPPPQSREGRELVYRNFGAPCVIYICTDRFYYYQSKGVNDWAIFDCGLIAENIMLLSPNYGLGTVAQAQAVAFPDVLRRVLQLPDSLIIVLGIAIGYPDWSAPANQRRSARAPAGEVVRWCGF